MLNSGNERPAANPMPCPPGKALLLLCATMLPCEIVRPHPHGSQRRFSHFHKHNGPNYARRSHSFAMVIEQLTLQMIA